MLGRVSPGVSPGCGGPHTRAGLISMPEPPHDMQLRGQLGCNVCVGSELIPHATETRNGKNSPFCVGSVGMQWLPICEGGGMILELTGPDDHDVEHVRNVVSHRRWRGMEGWDKTFPGQGALRRKVC